MRTDRNAVGRADPTGKHALFETPVTAAPDAIAPGRPRDGRHALFSSGPRRPGTVLVTCESCRARSRVSLVDVGLRLARLSVWLPGRRHPHRMPCPSCGRRTWCRIDWTG